MFVYQDGCFNILFFFVKFGLQNVAIEAQGLKFSCICARWSILLLGGRVALTSALVCTFSLRSSVEGFGLEAEARMTTWHVMMPSENESDSAHSHDVSEGGDA